MQKFFREFRVLLGVLLAAVSIQATAFPPFGFWDTVNAAADYTATLSPNENVSFIQTGADLALTTQGVQNAQSYGLKAVVAVQGFFFQNNGNSTTLLANYAQTWAVAASALTPYQSTLAAFYVYDEPNANGVSEANLEIEVNAIRQSFPNVPLIIVYSVGGAYTGISLVNWAGIDCYSNGQWSCNGQTYSQAYYNLKTQLVAGQETVLVPQAGYPSASNGCCNSALESELQRFIQLAIADTDVQLILPFIYQNVGTDPISFYGLISYGTGSGTMGGYFLQVGLDIKSGYSYPSNLSPALEFYYAPNNNHFVTLSVNEGLSNQYNFLGIAWNVYNSQISGTVPLYRCDVVSGNHHFASTQSNCEGQRFEGLYGYVYLSPQPGTTALHRYFDTVDGDFYDSTVTSAPSGYVDQGIKAYVPTVSIP